MPSIAHGCLANGSRLRSGTVLWLGPSGMESSAERRVSHSPQRACNETTRSASSQHRHALATSDLCRCSRQFAKTNDAKYHASKTRAEDSARCHGQSVVWSDAQDKSTADVLKERGSQVVRTALWLTRHDQIKGHVYGTLPLVHNLPVASSDHINVNPTIQGWLFPPVAFILGL